MSIRGFRTRISSEKAELIRQKWRCFGGYSKKDNGACQYCAVRDVCVKKEEHSKLKMIKEEVFLKKKGE